MITQIIMYFTIFYCTIHIFFKLIPSTFNTFLIRHIICPLLLTILSFIIYYIDKELVYLVPLILLWLISSILLCSPKKCFIASITSFCISYSIHAIISFPCALIVFSFFRHAEKFPFLLLATLTSCIQIIFTIFFFKIKRFEKGLSIFFTKPLSNIIIFIGIFLSAFLIQLISKKPSVNLQLFALMSIPFAFAFLIYWWQAQIRKTYQRSLELREKESLKKELQELYAAYAQVKEDNDRVHFINHRDNGLLTALDYATSSILEMDFSDEATVKEKCRELAAEVHRARDRRVATVHTTEIELPRYNTKVNLLNLLLNRTVKRAFDEHVLFTVHIDTELEDFVPSSVSDDDFVYLVSDLLENAFVATANTRSPMIQLQLYKWNKQLVVEIADNGLPFEVDSILQMGIERRTTHADTGGTGVGLITIWNIKETYGATYHLDEYDTASPFTKKISLTFDKKNRYSVRTYRKADILSRSKRIDLQVYSHDETS